MNQLPTNAFHRLQSWYASQCDGDWEHTYGVRIDTLDNPGWIVTIDLVDTNLQGLSLPLRRVDRSETDWVQYEVVDGRFVACGGARNLEELIERFLDLSAPLATSSSG